jgi:hypothetical protein
VIADVKLCIWNHHAAEQGRDRGLAVERMRAMYDQAGFNRLLAGIFGIERRYEFAYRHRRRTSPAGDHAGTCRGRVDVEASGHLKGLQELAQAALLTCLDDEVQGVFTLNDRLAENLHPVLPHVWAAQMVQELGTRVGVMRRAAGA